MEFKFSDIPDEVKEVWVLTYNPYGGINYFGEKMYDHIQGIIKKYPEWFPEDVTKEIFPKKNNKHL